MRLLESPQDSYSLDDFTHRNHIGLTTIYAEIKVGFLLPWTGWPATADEAVS
jgi:hypothetical protein